MLYAEAVERRTTWWSSGLRLRSLLVYDGKGLWFQRHVLCMFVQHAADHQHHLKSSLENVIWACYAHKECCGTKSVITPTPTDHIPWCSDQLEPHNKNWASIQFDLCNFQLGNKWHNICFMPIEKVKEIICNFKHTFFIEICYQTYNFNFSLYGDVLSCYPDSSCTASTVEIFSCKTFLSEALDRV